MSTPAQRRAKQTVRNLLLSLIVTLGLTFAIFLGVPRDDSNRIQQIDYLGIAREASATTSQLVLAPEIPENWWSNAARLEVQAGVETWYVGFVTEENEFLGLSQAFESNPSWLALTLAGNWQDGEREIQGEFGTWPTLTPSDPPGTKEYALVHKFGQSAVVIYGTADPEDFELLASAIVSQLTN